MNSKWSSESLDDLMSELDRMERERGTASDRRDFLTNARETLREADAILGLDSDLLSDLAAYPHSAARTMPKEADVIVRETRYGQEKFETPAPQEIYSHTLPEEDAPEVPSFMPEILVRQERTAKQPPKETEEDPAEPPVFPAEKSADKADGKTKVFSTTEPSPKGNVRKAPRIENADGLDGQIAFPGYEQEEPVPTVDEEEVEQEVNKRRSKAAVNFRLLEIAQNYDPDLPAEDILPEPEPSAPKKEERAPEYTGPEYTRLSERKEIASHLNAARRSSRLQIGILTLFEIAMVVLSVVAGGAQSDRRAVLYAISLFILSGAIAFSLGDILAGLRDLLHWKPSCKTAAALVSAAAFAQGVVAFILPGSEGIPCTFCAAAGLVLWFGKLNKLLEAYGTMSNFKFCAYTAADHLHTLHPLSEKKDCFEIGKNLKTADAQIGYTSKTQFPADFLRRSDYRTVVDKLCKYMIPAAFGAALITALFGWIRTKTGLSALTAFTGAICIAMPAGAAFASLLPVVLTMLRINDHGGMVVSPEAASTAAAVQALAVDVMDLYSGKGSDLGFEDYKTIRRDEMLMYAATMLFSAGSPVGGALRETFPDAKFLPQVKSLIYEERLGLSGYVLGQSVLLGNRNLLINHSVEAPPKSVELPYLNRGKRVLFLAVGNKVAAMFVATYKPKDTLRTPLKVIENNGVNLLVYAPDCNLHEEYIARGFGLSKGEVTLISPQGGAILRERSAQESENEPAGLMHNGTCEGMLRTFAGALTIHNIQRIGAFSSIISCGIGWLISFILMMIRGLDAVNWKFACLFTIVWTVIAAGLGIFQMLKSTEK